MESSLKHEKYADAQLPLVDFGNLQQVLSSIKTQVSDQSHKIGWLYILKL